MKILKKFIFLVAGICLLMTCSKSDEFLDDDLSVSDLNNVKCNRGKVFIVEPNGIDDTENLIQAFTDAKNSGKGSVVKLLEGDYFINFIEIREFHGSFIGAGKGKTIVTPITGLDCAALTSNNLFTVLISFIGGDIYMADMSLKTPHETLCADGGVLTGLLIFSDYSSQYISEKGYIKSFVNNVEFVGQWLDTDYNCYWGLIAYMNNNQYSLARSHIDITITNCFFDMLGIGADISSIKEGKLTLGTKNNGNVFSNCGWDDAQFCDNINVNISVVGNKFNIPSWFWGLYIDNFPYENRLNEPQHKRTLVKIESNEFNLVGGYNGLFFHDHRLISNPEENLPMFLSANNNKFNMSDDAYSGIWIYECKGPVISNNRFMGTGSLGIEVAPSGTADCYAEKGFIFGNDFSKSTFSIASIRLAEWTKNWTVIGGGNSNETIINLGIDNVIKEMHRRMNDKTFDNAHRQHPSFHNRFDEHQEKLLQH